MKMIKPTNALIGLLMLCFACKNSAIEKETPNGFKFEVVEKGDGIVPKAQQLLVFNYIIKDSKDSVWVDTYDNGFPGVVQIQDSAAVGTEIGMIQMFRMLSVRDSVSVTKSASSFFKDVLGRPIAPDIDTTISISVNLRVTAIMEMQKFAAYQTELMQKRVGRQKAKDEKLIVEYLSKNNITAEKDTSGIRFVMHATGGGAKPTLNDCVEVKYRGRFLKDEQEFDKNDKMAFRLTEVINGWKYTVPKLGVGDSATFYIPSHLAYGPQGMQGGIPPDAIMIFDVTLLKVGSQFDPQNRVCN